MTRVLAEVLVIAMAMAGGGRSTIAFGEPVTTRSMYFSFTPVN